MTRFTGCIALSITLGACAVTETNADTPDTVATGTVEQAGIQMQGIQMQGIQMQGIQMQGMSLVGFSVNGATLDGDPLQRVRVQKGEVVADRTEDSVRGSGLIGAHFIAQVQNLDASPPATATAEFRIADIDPEISKYNPTGTGH